MPTTILNLPDEILLQIYEYLPTRILKDLRLVRDFAPTIQQYLFAQSQFSLQLDDGTSGYADDGTSGYADDGTSRYAYNEECVCFEEAPIAQGVNMCQFTKLSSQFQHHISQFHNYRVNLTICNFTQMVNQLEKYHEVIKLLFQDNPYRRSGKHLNVKVVIYLTYSMNNFNDVKDSFMNIDKISKRFSNNGLNHVVVDLQLVKSNRD
ncbi:hypothetical protein KGF56_000674 [Candida oxycetoniae]|uniref:F-box domain-containing protein n=1 Tax=Candida oxycetoniae TaxID=497107 RepID=A0AAI9T184_9ASCO|nr:uncharacterized protein KGF56_000674 [Candida oxycetoniae]KAI3406542.2 hypothetical protein KGF56_000674 [Candida oxycetoniae]